MNCRHCAAPLAHTFLDLGFAPPSNAYLTAADLARPESYFPLKINVCDRCWLVQTEDYAEAGAFFGADYAYYSSTTAGWLAHAASYVKKIIRQLQLTRDNLVIEVASNDGYLLKNFVAAGIPCLGIEPTAGTAAAAEKLGIPVLREFFGERLARQLAVDGRQADLITGNNVYGHVPDINDFTRGLKSALKPGGTITLEFPHVMRLLEHTQFDTVYHEHFSYLSLYSTDRIFKAAGLRIFDVEELPTQGGSLRIYGSYAEDPRPTSRAFDLLLAEEARRGLCSLLAFVRISRRRPTGSRMTCFSFCSNKNAGERQSLPTAQPPKAIPFLITPASSAICFRLFAMPPSPSKASSCRAATSRSCRRPRWRIDASTPC